MLVREGRRIYSIDKCDEAQLSLFDFYNAHKDDNVQSISTNVDEKPSDIGEVPDRSNEPVTREVFKDMSKNDRRILLQKLADDIRKSINSGDTTLEVVSDGFRRPELCKISCDRVPEVEITLGRGRNSFDTIKWRGVLNLSIDNKNQTLDDEIGRYMKSTSFTRRFNVPTYLHFGDELLRKYPILQRCSRGDNDLFIEYTPDEYPKIKGISIEPSFSHGGGVSRRLIFK